MLRAYLYIYKGCYIYRNKRIMRKGGIYMQLEKNQVCRIKTNGLTVVQYAQLLSQLGNSLVTLSSRESIIIERV